MLARPLHAQAISTAILMRLQSSPERYGRRHHTVRTPSQANVCPTSWLRAITSSRRQTAIPPKKSTMTLMPQLRLNMAARPITGFHWPALRWRHLSWLAPSPCGSRPILSWRWPTSRRYFATPTCIPRQCSLFRRMTRSVCAGAAAWYSRWPVWNIS